MRAFDELTARGKAWRLRHVAMAALAQYPLQPTGVSLVGMYTNTLFRVRTAEGTSYVVRVCAPGWRTDTDLRSEALWLAALDRDADIGAPRPLAAGDGEYLVRAEADGLSCRCMVMGWVPGKPLGRHLTPANLEKMGALFARLHAYGAAFQPPDGFTTRRIDRVLARGEADVLFAPQTLAALSPADRERLTRLRDVVAEAYAWRYEAAETAPPQVIHDDLWHDNIHLYRGRLYPLDFEDTCWGYPVQDLAMALQDLMDDTEPAAFEALAPALRRGYEQLCPWPEAYEGEIDCFRAGRTLWVANYVAAHQAEYLGSQLARMAPLWDRFLETGRLRKG